MYVIIIFTGSLFYSLAVDSFLVSYRDSVMRSLPDVRTLISLRQHLLGSDKTQVARVDKFSPDDQLRNVGE